MSGSATVERPQRLFSDSEWSADRQVADAGAPIASPGDGRLTLEQRLDRVWEGLHADRDAQCPMCQGRMAVHGEVPRCGDCGSRVL